MHPDVRINVLVTERPTDHIVDGLDLIFQCGGLKDSNLVGRRLLSYRHQLMAAPEYLERFGKPRHPNDLLTHRIISFARCKPNDRWIFENARSKEIVKLSFEPHLAINDYSGVLPALLAGLGIGDLPPIVQPQISRKMALVEVMPQWRFKGVELWLFHAGKRHTARPVRAFLDFAAREVTKLFPQLPS
jgi:DNA-binding transcriptional LysR family regulator